VPTLAERADVDLLYWIGCAATFDPRVRRSVIATIAILKAAGLSVGILGGEERCTGDPARRIGEEGLFQDLALRNIETFERYGVTKILTHCAHCYNTFRNEYSALGARIEVVHHAALLADLIGEGRIRPLRAVTAAATIHDSCYLARFNRQVEPPRAALRAIPGLRIAEMERRGVDTFCCGAGGGQYWYEVPRREKVSAIRLREARRTGAETLVSECPFCLKMFEDELLNADPEGRFEIRDIAEVVAASLAVDSPSGSPS
jgi:Fe-S oxidoreductase